MHKSVDFERLKRNKNVDYNNKKTPETETLRHPKRVGSK